MAGKSLKALDIRIEEKYLQAKTGNLNDCEDFIHVSEHFVAVIDGATSKTAQKWHNETGGQVAVRLIDEILRKIPPTENAYRAIEAMTAKIFDFYKQLNILEAVRRGEREVCSAVLAVLSLKRQEIWRVGDCQYCIDNELTAGEKAVDRVLAEARAVYLESEILKQVSIAQLIKKDTGREMILPLLKRSLTFQNNPRATWWYAVINGFPVPREGIHIKKIPPNTREIILATDGYPVLKNHLKASEKALKYILENDPLLFRKFKSTKGLTGDNVSFDDRAYVKIKIKHHEN